jgi:hypothetical protein
MKTGPGGVAAVFAGVLVVAGGLGWLLYEVGGSDASEPAGEETAEPDKPGPARRVRSKEEQLPELGPGPHEVPAKPVSKEGRLRYEFEGHADLALRDWADVAGAVKDMNGMILDTLENGVPGPEETERRERLFKIGERYQHIVVMRPRGSLHITRNTSPEHPAYAVNLIAVMLERARLPLTEQQARRLVDLAKERGPRYDEAVTKSETPDPAAWTLERLAEPAKELDSFFGEVNATLTAAQSAALVPDVLRNRARADCFSAASAWGRLAEPMAYSKPEQLPQVITDGLASRFGIPDRRGEILPIVESWLSTFAPDTPDLLDRRGFIRSQYVSRAVPRMVDLLKQVVEGLQFSEELALAAREFQRAYVPLQK